MPKLPVFSTIVQAMAVFGLHCGKILAWLVTPVFLGGGAVAAAVGLAAWRQALGHGFNIWLAPVGVAIVFAIQTVLPLVIRINQLAVHGRVEQAGYMEMIFSPRCFRYLGYGCIVSAIMAAGLILAMLPAGLGAHFAWNGGGLSGASALGIALSSALALAFMVLTTPLHLVFPAVAVEPAPALGRAYNLGAHSKVRLFLAIFLSALFFAALTRLFAMAGELLSRGGHPLFVFILLPVQMGLVLFSWVTSISVPAVAYRILSGLPDPQGEPQDAPESGGGDFV
jgi:hypothetical protein